MIWDDEDPDQITVHTEENIGPILDSVQRDREIMPHGVNKLVGRFPASVFERSVLEQWDEDDWRRWLNSSEAAPFRIWQGRC